MFRNRKSSLTHTGELSREDQLNILSLIYEKKIPYLNIAHQYGIRESYVEFIRQKLIAEMQWDTSILTEEEVIKSCQLSNNMIKILNSVEGLFPETIQNLQTA